MGADSHWSRALPWGTPSMTSTRTTVRASSFSASRCAVVAPTLPAPTTVIRLSMGSRECRRSSDGTKLIGSVRLFTHARAAVPVAVDDNDGGHDVAGGVTYNSDS